MYVYSTKLFHKLKVNCCRLKQGGGVVLSSVVLGDGVLMSDRRACRTGCVESRLNPVHFTEFNQSSDVRSRNLCAVSQVCDLAGMILCKFSFSLSSFWDTSA